MKKVNVISGYDLYSGKDENHKPMYNIVRCGAEAPITGYYAPEYIAKIKKVNPSFFFPS